MKRNPILDIINDDVIIFAHRKKLAKQGVTPLHKLNDSTVSFLLFLEAHNALLDFIDTFKDYNTDKHKSIALYFANQQPKYYFKGAFNWQMTGYYHIWSNLNELWNNQIKNKCK